MSVILVTHLLAVGIWIGCLLVEILFEHAVAKDGPLALVIARLHVRVDLLVEVPAFLAVLLTGLLMLANGAGDLLIQVKSAVGVAAVALNGYCVWLVVQRCRLAEGGDACGFLAMDRHQHRAGGGVVVLLGLALALGGWRAVL